MCLSFDVKDSLVYFFPIFYYLFKNLISFLYLVVFDFVLLHVIENAVF
jgi:hypothetical protein